MDTPPEMDWPSHFQQQESSTTWVGDTHRHVVKQITSSKSTYCGGRRHRFQNIACVHIGGNDTNEQLPSKSPIHNPGHITNGMMHMCKHIGTRPPVGIGSSRD